MKKNILSYLAVLIFPAILMGAYFLATPAQAQQTCAVNNVGFRTYKEGGMGAENFYQESDRPIVYIDVQTSDCSGIGLEFSLVEMDLTLAGSTNIDALNDELIIIGGLETDGAGAFTIVMRAGNENCEDVPGTDCEYFLQVENEDDTDLHLSDTSVAYDTPIGAPSDWEFIDIIPLGNDMGGTNGLDVYAPGNTVGNTFENEPPQIVDQVDGPSVIDLNLPNPIAGTIDTIPEFFQKVVDFILTIGIPLIAMAIVYSGFLFVTARGSDGQLEKAKEAFTYAIIGGMVLLAAWLVAGAIQDALLSI